MNPGSQWIVEFAARENRAREQRARGAAEPQVGVGGVVAAREFGQWCSRRLGRLVLVAAAWLNRPVGAAPRAGRAAEAWTDRKVDPGTPSWT